jgi:hypothetical protein
MGLKPKRQAGGGAPITLLRRLVKFCIRLFLLTPTLSIFLQLFFIQELVYTSSREKIKEKNKHDRMKGERID